MKNQIIYISYDGVLDNLGYSQIVCYLKDLSKNYDIILISYEKKTNLKNSNIKNLSKELLDNNIEWHYLKYHKYPKTLSTIYDIFLGSILLYYLLIKKKIDIVHCRSYIPGLIVLISSFLKKFKIIFDIRGFWIDEKSDRSGLKKNSFTYRFFKKIEKKLFFKSDYIITLTRNSKKILIDKYPNFLKEKITVIPTCADPKLFFYDHQNIKYLSQKDEIVLGYIGSADTAYNIEKVIIFYSYLINDIKKIRLKILTETSHDIIQNLMKKHKIPTNKFSINYVNRNKIYEEILEFDFGVFYLNENYSVKASFPTKIAEFLLCGKPIICNNFNEDIFDILKMNKIGYIYDFNQKEYEKVLKFIKEFNKDNEISNKCNEFAYNNLSLQYGSNEYKKIYELLV